MCPRSVSGCGRGQWFTVVGVLAPVPLAEELDLAALVGWPAARSYLSLTAVRPGLHPYRGEPGRGGARGVGADRQPTGTGGCGRVPPSDALAARRPPCRAQRATARSRCRRAPGGWHRHSQHDGDLCPATADGGGSTPGTGCHPGADPRPVPRRGAAALGSGWDGRHRARGGHHRAVRVQPAVANGVPAWAMAGGIAATVLVGTIAGLYPAIRASRSAHHGPGWSLTCRAPRAVLIMRLTVPLAGSTS